MQWLACALLLVGSGCVQRALDLPLRSSGDLGMDLASDLTTFTGTVPAQCAGTQNVMYLACGAPNCGLSAPQTIMGQGWEGVASVGDMVLTTPGEPADLVALGNPQGELFFWGYPLAVGVYDNLLSTTSFMPPAGNTQPTFNVGLLAGNLEWQPITSGTFTVYDISIGAGAPTDFTASFEANDAGSIVTGCVHYQQ